MRSRITRCLVVCLSAVWSFLVSHQAAALDVKDLKVGHFLFAVEGTVDRVQSFYGKYAENYVALGSTIGNLCTQTSNIYHDAYYYVVFMCNPDPNAPQLVQDVFDSVAPDIMSDSESLSMTTTNTLTIGGNPVSCAGKKCKRAADSGATCTYYQCPIDPWCYHTGLACQGTHKCP